MQALKQLSAALLLCGLAAHASAATALDTYGPGNATDGWASMLTDSQHLAVAFDIASPTTIQSLLTSIDGVGGVTVGILARSGSVPTDAAWLYSTHLVDPWANTAISPAGWTLAAGTYWLAAVGDAGFAGQWQSGTDNPSVAWAYTESAGAWQAVTTGFTGAPAARISVSAVPEPATYGLMALGALVVGAAARRKQQQG
ncbi:MAG: PEP-CTERM sorting domain-containing protein [Rubrivivax sp.]|nr:MAG: PEP-CTERM sorting domain-containing protein [Rubrivivax sp.]